MRKKGVLKRKLTGVKGGSNIFRILKNIENTAEQVVENTEQVIENTADRVAEDLTPLPQYQGFVICSPTYDNGVDGTYEFINNGAKIFWNSDGSVDIIDWPEDSPYTVKEYMTKNQTERDHFDLWSGGSLPDVLPEELNYRDSTEYEQQYIFTKDTIWWVPNQT